MRFTSSSLFFLGLMSMAFSCMTRHTQVGGQSQVKEFVNRQILGNSFGLDAKELVLTLDDGPGPRTQELAKFLFDENVPATFFMVGNKIAAYPGVIEEVAAYKKNGRQFFIIANHSSSHSTALNSAGNQWAISEIQGAHNLLEKHVHDGFFFMRPPYGALAGSPGIISAINETALSNYIGPIFWDIGGAMDHGYAADWACWPQKYSVASCTSRYMAEVNARGRGIVLMHDVHYNTVEMLMGQNGFIRQAKNSGYSFVRLDKRGEDLGVEFRAQAKAAGPAVASVTVSHIHLANGEVKFSLLTQNAGYVSAAYRSHRTGASQEIYPRTAGATHTFSHQFMSSSGTPAAGSYFLEITTFDAEGVENGIELYPFTVAAQYSEPASCVNLQRLQPGFSFGVKHGNDYQFHGKLQLVNKPLLVSSDEVQLLFDLTYDADPNDRSQVAVNINVTSGNIVSGYRYNWTHNPNISWTIKATNVSCQSYPKQWEGVISANGADQPFRITMDQGDSLTPDSDTQTTAQQRRQFCAGNPKTIQCLYPSLASPNRCTIGKVTEFFMRSNGYCQACSTVDDAYKRFYNICEYTP